MAGKLKLGALVKILDPQELALGNCSHGVVIAEHIDFFPEDSTRRDCVAYRILCGSRMMILCDYEFVVV